MMRNTKYRLLKLGIWSASVGMHIKTASAVTTKLFKTFVFTFVWKATPCYSYVSEPYCVSPLVPFNHHSFRSYLGSHPLTHYVIGKGYGKGFDDHVQRAIRLPLAAFSSVVLSRPSCEECGLPSHGCGQRAVQSTLKNLLSANGPTSGSCLLRCSESSFGTSSSATSSSLLLETRCCIDRLKSQSHSGHLQVRRC